jgi:tRNA(adenine34) deaminase
MGCLGGAVDLNTLPQSNHRLTITRGLLEKPCLDLLQAYFQLKRKED